MTLPFPLTNLVVQHVDQFWLATKADAPWLEDVDALEGQRHSDRDKINWLAVGRAVQGFATAMNDGELHPSTDYEDWVHAAEVKPRRPFVPLSEVERNIVQTFFDPHEALRFDPWSDPENGRHRTWNVWSADPGLLLPVRSSVLAWRPGVDFDLSSIRNHVAENLARLPKAVSHRSPEYVRRLNALAD